MCQFAFVFFQTIFLLFLHSFLDPHITMILFIILISFLTTITAKTYKIKRIGSTTTIPYKIKRIGSTTTIPNFNNLPIQSTPLELQLKVDTSYTLVFTDPSTNPTTIKINSNALFASEAVRTADNTLTIVFLSTLPKPVRIEISTDGTFAFGESYNLLFSSTPPNL